MIQTTRARSRDLAWAVSMVCATLLAHGSSHAEPVDGARIEAAAVLGKEWLSHGLGYSEQRFSPLTQINDQNVKNLGLAWYLDLENNRGLEATPLLVDGVLYTTLSWSRVIAVDARTGKLKWAYDPLVHKGKAGEACCDAVNRGVAVWGNKVFVGTLDGRLVSLDRDTGKKIWEVQTTDPEKAYSITGAPRVVKGKVIIGNGGAEFGVRGYVSAYDADSGALAWRFYTVPGDPKKPYEHPELAEAAKTWKGGKYWEYGGGGTVWDSMAYDPEADLLYVGVGNGSPWNREVRSPGGGDNLFLSSILAIRPDTGRLAWHYQGTPGDSWDFTATQQITLADMEINGTLRKVLMQAPKNGFFYVLDRVSGELLSAEKFGKVTWAEKVDLKTGRPVEAEGVRYEDKPVVMWPGPFGAHSWHSMSYSPRTGYVYLPYQEVPGVYRNEGKDFRFGKKGFNTASGLSDFTAFPREAVSGALLAWDPVKQKEAWRFPHTHFWNGGVLSTAGNLVFQGTADGRMVAYTADTGKQRWSFPAQTGVVAAPMSYELDGKQYVAIMAGWGGVATLLGGDQALAPGVRNVSRLLVFALDGTAELPSPAAQPVKPPRDPKPVKASATVLEKGKVLYHSYCMECHGVGGISGGLTPDLRHSSDDIRQAYGEIVLDGALERNGMPRFGGVLAAPDIEAIKAYVMQQEYIEAYPPPPDKK